MNKHSIDYDIKTIIKNVAAKKDNNQKRYIITGGPGAGKTSIINYLAKLNYFIATESATEIIEHDIRQGLEKPWKSEDYHKRVAQLNKQKQNLVVASNSPIVFFDRGHLDGITYILLQKRKLDSEIINFVEASMNFFDTTVFFIENFDFIKPGPARTETIEQALEKAYHLEYNYNALGYKILKIPIGKIEERADKILDYIKFF